MSVGALVGSTDCGLWFLPQFLVVALGSHHDVSIHEDLETTDFESFLGTLPTRLVLNGRAPLDYGSEFAGLRPK